MFTTTMESHLAFSSLSFPLKLHHVLDVVEAEGLSSVVSWQPHGKAFRVHQPRVFVEVVLKRFFCQTKYPSFQRQLNLYGFSRFKEGPDKGAYHHPRFVKGNKELSRDMPRFRVKGCLSRGTSVNSYFGQPDFYDHLASSANISFVQSQLPPLSVNQKPDKDTLAPPQRFMSPLPKLSHRSYSDVDGNFLDVPFPDPLPRTSTVRIVSLDDVFPPRLSVSSASPTKSTSPATNNLVSLLGSNSAADSMVSSEPLALSNSFDEIAPLGELIQDGKGLFDSDGEETPASDFFDESIFDNVFPDTIDSVFH